MILASILDLFSQDPSALAPEALPITDIVFTLVLVFVLSLVILFTYRFSYQTTVYSKSFAITLPIISMITTVIIISVSSNIILSLGMVGALSIVRFRTAIKNPFDLAFLFWSIGLGVTAGARMGTLAMVSTIIIAVVIFLLILLETFTSSYFLIIRAFDANSEEQILEAVKELYGKYNLRNKTVKSSSLDLTLEVRSKEEKTLLVNALMDIDGVKSVMLLSHQGDYISE